MLKRQPLSPKTMLNELKKRPNLPSLNLKVLRKKPVKLEKF